MKTPPAVKFFFLTIGLTALTVAGFWFKHTADYISQSSLAEGTVVDLTYSGTTSQGNGVYLPVITFETKQGKDIRFVGGYGANPPMHEVGEQITVIYPHASPNQAEIKGFFSLWGGSSILFGIGLVFFSIGAVMLYFSSKSKRRAAHLKLHGTTINATIKYVMVNDRVSVNGKNPYQIQAEWKNPTTGLHLQFLSDNIWVNPVEHLKSDQIQVLIDMQDTTLYHVDVSFLPKPKSE
ncbi:DUF3592 domain-containing protein [Vibrio sp. LaRot3]|uniref:DUF3592 domain-containing protein n=1 Tax=Vibrio sp. LaRot3 TaxID=2998829 RepID=UPI0022CDE6CF|nr:DUF3592 domain-containing protein [Vibrio sp. LaRot3]MDA0148983.1 DUF3592 domain-containing protein [Vibrio sp. LaRot3]